MSKVGHKGHECRSTRGMEEMTGRVQGNAVRQLEESMGLCDWQSTRGIWGRRLEEYRGNMRQVSGVQQGLRYGDSGPKLGSHVTQVLHYKWCLVCQTASFLCVKECERMCSFTIVQFKKSVVPATACLNAANCLNISTLCYRISRFLQVTLLRNLIHVVILHVAFARSSFHFIEHAKHIYLR